MDKNYINILLRNLYYSNDPISDDSIYDSFKAYVASVAEYFFYHCLEKQNIYSINFIIDEIWLEFWLECTNNLIHVGETDDLKIILADIAYDLIILLNR